MDIARLIAENIYLCDNDWEKTGLLEVISKSDKENRKLLANYLERAHNYILDENISIYNNSKHEESSEYMFLDINVYIFPIISRIFKNLHDNKNVRSQILLAKIIVEDIVDDLFDQMQQIMKHYGSLKEYFVKSYGESKMISLAKDNNPSLDHEIEFVVEFCKKWIKKMMTYR
jgi:oligoribonuclease (3'-5' exoribonuclease)